MFGAAADGDIDEYTDSVSAYISKCIDDIVPRVNFKTFPNQKPWVNGDVRSKLTARSSAYTSGDLEALRKSRYDLWKAITDAYRDKLESRRMLWTSIVDYKGRNRSDAWLAASLSDELNTFWFEVSNTIPMATLAEDQDDCILSLSAADVRRAFKSKRSEVTRARWHSRPCPQSVPQQAWGSINLYFQPFPESVCSPHLLQTNNHHSRIKEISHHLPEQLRPCSTDLHHSEVL